MDTKRQNSPSLIDNVQILHSDYTISIVYYQTNFNSISHFQMNKNLNIETIGTYYEKLNKFNLKI